jgi:hypothetical protein
VTAKTFPCSVSSLWRFVLHHHPSPLGLRQVNNGDRHLEVGAGSALKTWASTLQHTIRAHSPHLGYRQALPCPGIPCEDSNLERAIPSGQKYYIRTWCRPSGTSRSSQRNVHRWAPGASAQMPCLPLRSDHPYSSSVVEKPSDLENQIGRMYFRSDPVKYCKNTIKRTCIREPYAKVKHRRDILPVVNFLDLSKVFILICARATCFFL